MKYIIMLKNCIVICGGGGKTTLYNNNPKRYLDIDFYIWNNNERKLKLEEFIKNEKFDKISELYQNVMKNDEKLRNDNRIILVHKPENAELLNRNILGIYRPCKKLHLKNIENRNEFLKKLAINDWEDLGKYNPIEFSQYPFFEL